MRVIIVLVLFITLSFQLVAKLGIVVMYEVNRDYIAQNLCENRSKPKMHCNGKCYLKKQLKKTEDTGSNNKNSSQSESFQFISFVLPPIYGDIVCKPTENNFLKHFPQYSSSISVLTDKGIFHPPQVTC